MPTCPNRPTLPRCLVVISKLWILPRRCGMAVREDPWPLTLRVEDEKKDGRSNLSKYMRDTVRWFGCEPHIPLVILLPEQWSFAMFANIIQSLALSHAVRIF